MKRRVYLTVTGTTITAGVAGCLGELSSSNSGGAHGDTEPEDENSPSGGDETEAITETNGASDLVEDIMIQISNSTSKEETVHLTVSTDGQTIAEEELIVGPNGSQIMATGISETGRYELTIIVEGGPEESYPFNIGDYALRQGSNIIVQLREEDISIMIEE